VVAAGTGWSIPVGCTVLDIAGEKVGTVAGADADALIVGHAIFWQYRIPFSAVADYDGEVLRLKVTKEAVRRGDRDALPNRAGNERGGEGA
jgi:hypothetical protein